MRIVGDHVRIQPVRAHAVFAPDTLDGERRSPLRNELVVAGELAANIDSACLIAPKHNAPRSTRQGRIAVTLAHHSIQFSTLLERQHGSLHSSIAGALHRLSLIQ
jgi:hypothetical protein